jgi:hypothetical protein
MDINGEIGKMIASTSSGGIGKVKQDDLRLTN